MWDSLNDEDSCQCPSKAFTRCDSDQDSFIDKENISPTKNQDLSLYESTSPIPVSCAERSPSHHRQITRLRSLDEHDPNSQDSGYQGEHIHNKFVSYNSATPESFNSFGSLEDEFLEDFSDVEPLEKPSTFPVDFNKLINNPLRNKTNRENRRDSPKDNIIRPLFRRALSLQNTTTVTPNSKVRTSLFTSELESRSFKRPDPPTPLESTLIKRSKLFDSSTSDHVSRPIFQRAFSATEESIMCAVQRSSTEPDLIGDFSKIFCLPLVRGKHQDLKAISSETLVKLMKGEYNEKIASFKVIDCRYPYEYEGGHINGAINIYTKEQCQKLLQDSCVPEQDTAKRHILVFHCEFSSERGPNLYRYLRKEDRHKNESTYPNLHYPEIYLLEGGYKSFFNEYSDMCTPIAYKEMLHPDHEHDLRLFRQKSKTWNADTRVQRPQFNRSLKRL